MSKEVRNARETAGSAEGGQASSSSLGWWLVLAAAVLIPIVIVLAFCTDEPLVSPFVYRI